MFVVLCGVWQWRQLKPHEPYFVPTSWLECVLSAWQSRHSSEELSRTSRLPSPLPAALTVMTTGVDVDVWRAALVTWTLSV
jgi:hypothetical protein